MNNIVSALEANNVLVGDVVFYINSKCNLRCKHCYVGNDLLAQSTEYSFDEFRSILSQFHNLDRLTILGGEPLLHESITEIIAFSDLATIVERRITTNLTQLSNDLLHALGRSKFRVCVSLDGHNPAINDTIRGRGVFDKVVENLARLRKVTDNIEITHTINRDNVSSFADFLALARKLNISMINLHRMNPRGNARHIANKVLSPTEWRDFIASLYRAPKCAVPIRIRFELGYATDSELDSLIGNQTYHSLSESSFYSDSKRNRVVFYPDRKVYISSESFGSESFIGELISGEFHFNTSEMNEMSLSMKTIDWIPLVNPELAGDEMYPHALSVSYRQQLYM